MNQFLDFCSKSLFTLPKPWVWCMITACGWSKGHKSLFLSSLIATFKMSPLHFSFENFGDISPVLYLTFFSSFELCWDWASFAISGKEAYVITCHLKALPLMILDNYNIKNKPVGQCWGHQCHHLSHRTLCPWQPSVLMS